MQRLYILIFIMKECELVYPSFLGKIVIRFIGDKIVKIFVIKDNKENTDIVKINKNYIQVYKEFDRYFNGLKEEFSYTRKFLDFSFLTVFQRKVYNELMKIEYGSFITYTQLARKLGNENLKRAVGIALKMNPF